MTNRDIMRIAMEQSAEDMGCRPEDFLAADNVVVPLRLGARARAYYREPILCNFISYEANCYFFEKGIDSKLFILYTICCGSNR